MGFKLANPLAGGDVPKPSSKEILDDKVKPVGRLDYLEKVIRDANGPQPTGRLDDIGRELEADTATSSPTSSPTVQPTPKTESGGDASSGAVTETLDDRLRISALPGQEPTVYGANDRSANILAPLYNTGGLLFPYTPSIQIAQEVMWQSHDLTHTNFDVLSYQRTPSATIGVTGKFTVQNQREGEYALACIHFLRTVSKMYFGSKDIDGVNETGERTAGLAGLPPPVLRLRGYGTYMFNSLRCVLKGFSFGFDENMDLVRIESPAGGHVTLPPLFSITINIGLQSNMSKTRTDFVLNEFRTGSLLKSGSWF